MSGFMRGRGSYSTRRKQAGLLNCWIWKERFTKKNYAVRGVTGCKAAQWETATQLVANEVQRGVGGRKNAANLPQKQYGLQQPGEGSAP